jgi:hypothetical protein
VGDFDDDGDLDLLISGIDARPLLLRNDTPRAGHWLKIRLLNQFGSPAINARASVTCGGSTQLREVRSGSTYQSQNSLDLHFGLGSAPRVDRVVIIWPGGARSELTDVAADQTLILRQPLPGSPVSAAQRGVR